MTGQQLRESRLPRRVDRAPDQSSQSRHRQSTNRIPATRHDAGGLRRLSIRTRRERTSHDTTDMPATPDDLFSYLRNLGIETTTISHPPLFTVADSQHLRGEIAGGHTKNLFLKDKKDSFFLITADENAAIDLKSVHKTIGAASRVSFGKPEALLELLGVTPGAVTLFALLNDTSGRVKFYLDESLLDHDVINAHPLTNDATTSIRADDMRRFVAATGHELNILKTGG